MNIFHLFSYLYEICIKLSKHRLAPWFLCADSFAESFFWPIPPDVMLAPMCLARPNRALRYALVTTVSSVLGAVCGYYLGYFIYDPYVKDLIAWAGQSANMAVVREWFTLRYGVLMVFAGAFTPIPYKIIAITCGVVAAESVQLTGSAGQLNLIYFVLVSLCGRGLRFYLEAGIIKLGGERMERAVRRYIDYLGWLCVALIVLYLGYSLLA